jgi:pimeloyl-ACP methyl ester carboxylesterase
MAEAGPREQTLTVAGLKLFLQTSGEGPPLLVLHHDIGSPSWLLFYEALAQNHAVYVPDLPGFGHSERPAWARHPRDLAILMLQLLDELGLEDTRLVGLGFGGWIAAEMATMAQSRFPSLVLAAPFGIKPLQGEILDQLMLSHIDYVKAGFRDDTDFEHHFQSEPDPDLSLCWELNREMTARLAWKPYMFSHQLPQLLRGVHRRTLVVWGELDRVAPVECGKLYLESMPNAELVVLPDTGHFIEIERPEKLADLITKHG